ncbi:MAG: nucleotidyl transferase AbiEii/AbiGii toxin family protein [Ferruginibacter sp.]|jgi:predicted nucleotidyltransferase component of viral defense system
MIPQAYITAWRNKAPWQDDFQVEQDLIIERALIEIFNNPFLKERLAFRGGTALHKLHLSPSARYSEDIDLVQIKAEPFGPVIDELRKSLSFLGTPAVKQKQHNNTMVYRIESEGGIPLKLKVEINCREHFTVYGIQDTPLKMESAWVNAEALIPTYDITELLGTKLRALYQRRKGRDLFDLWHAITQTNADTAKIIHAWKYYMNEEGHSISKQEFLENLEKKMTDKDFIGDMEGLLRPGLSYQIKNAYNFVKKELLERI